MPKYVFGLLVRYKLLSLCDNTIVITIEFNGIHNFKEDGSNNDEQVSVFFVDEGMKLTNTLMLKSSS